MITVHLRINDEATGRPTPVRLRVSGPDGTAYAPFGRLTDFPTGRNEAVGGHLRLGRENSVYVDGACELRLPTDVPLRVNAVKGPEYEPLDREVTLGAGQMALRFTIRRWSDVAADGWLAGDTRAHFLPPDAALLEAAAEDLRVVNLLVCPQPVLAIDGNTYPTLPNMAAFSGQVPALEADGRAVVVNTLNAHPVLGRVGLLNSHRTVFPLTFGGDTDTDDWSVTDWCGQCHRKNGLAVWVDAFRPGAGMPGGEALVAAVLGHIDAIEFDAHPRGQPFLPWWYRLLNAGVRLPLAGGSGKDSNRVPLGAVRTYARTGPASPPGYRGWIEAARAGRTFVTNGPLLRLDVAGRGPGEVVAVADPGGGVAVRAAAECLTPFERLEVVADGDVIAAAPATAAGRWRAAVEVVHPMPAPGWLAARCVGGQGAFLNPGQPAFAHTSPVYVRLAGRPPAHRPAAVAVLRRCVEQTRDWVELHGRFTDEKRRNHLLELFTRALARLTPGEPPSGGPA